jgi:cytochrome b561
MSERVATEAERAAPAEVPPGRYTRIAMALHWAIAVLVLLNLLLAWRFEGLEGAARGAPIRLHKSIGVTILALMVVRLGWRLARPPPPFAAHLGPAERRLARAVHWSFYGLLILQPLVGWAMISADAGGRPTRVWGALPWPRIQALADLTPALREEVHGWLGAVHLGLGLAIAALVVAHVAGALKHQFWDHDGALRRITPF